MTPQSARDALRALAAARAAVPAAPGDERTRYPGEGRRRSAGRAGLRNANEKMPTVVFFHGGGWVAGDLETHDRQARLLAIETGAVVISVDYRRPPEVGFRRVRGRTCRRQGCRRTHRRVGGDAARVGVAGDSAGGNLAATVAIACRDAGIKLAAQLLVYPVTDVAGNYADAKENARFPSRAEMPKAIFCRAR